MTGETHAPTPRERTVARAVRHAFRAPLVLLAGTEFLLLLFVPLVARMVLGLPSTLRLWFGALDYALLIVVALLSMGLYSRRQRSRLTGILLRVGAAIVFAATAMGLQSYLFPSLAMERPIFLLSGPLAFGLIGLARYLFESVVNEDMFRRRVLVFGVGKRAMSVTQLRRRSDTRGFLVVGFAPTQGDRPLVARDRIIDVGGNLLRFCRIHDVDEIVVAMDDRRQAFPVHDLLECRLAGIAVTDLVDFLESETGKVRLDVLNPSWMIFAPGFNRSFMRQFSERLLDLSACIALLAIAWPVLLLTALAIKLEEGPRAPVLYRQVRVGLGGRLFDVLKFRSMRVDAEKAGQAMWATERDPRITRVGTFIRKTRIDELPQLINVLRGDMSFVGPRPERPEFVQEFEQTIPYYRERHSVKPGITGWAQLCYPYGASAQDAVDKLQYDLYYVKNHSLVFDLMILLQTAEVILWGKGAR